MPKAIFREAYSELTVLHVSWILLHGIIVLSGTKSVFAFPACNLQTDNGRASIDVTVANLTTPDSKVTVISCYLRV